MSGTVLFVHGTGVRQGSYFHTFAQIKAAFEKHQFAHALQPCLWGDKLGSRPPSRSLPVPIAVEATELNEEQEIARWRLLYADPLFELRLLKNRPRVAEPGLPGASARPGELLWKRIFGYQLSSEVRGFLDTFQLDQDWPDAWEFALSEDLAKDVTQSAVHEIREPGQAVARAAVATLLRDPEEAGRLVLDAEHRDALVEMLVTDWQADVAGIGAYLSRFFVGMTSRIATPIVKWKRGSLSEMASAALGDILLYQVRGDAIRSYIRDSIRNVQGEKYVLAHSLGGIACVDLLAREELGVKGLITVGSQAPLLYEIGALWGVEPQSTGLPTHFPRWLNLYDTNDFLSYVAHPVFGRATIRDVRIRSRQPFPQSHSAYWANAATWEAIGDFIR
jgi:hypothetical protein